MTTITTPSPRAFALSAALTLAVGLLLAPPPASAAVTYTYAGMVSSGFDETGVFGLAGQNLAGLGLTFTATFVREDLPGADSYIGPTASGIGGFFPNSPVQGEVTINGRTLSFGSSLGQQFQANEPDGCGPGCEIEEFIHSAETRLNDYDPETGVSNFINNGLALSRVGNNENFLTSADYRTLSSMSPGQLPGFGGRVQVEEYVLGPDGARRSYSYGFARLAPTSLMVSDGGGPVAAVPEPASWALMILGFGGVGAALRARRRISLPA